MGLRVLLWGRGVSALGDGLWFTTWALFFTRVLGLPLVDAPVHVTYDNIFRVIIMQFLDAHNFDVRSVKKTCVHIVHPDGRIIPFDTYNLFYRDERERDTQQSLLHHTRPACTK